MQLGFDSSISTALFTGGDITERSLPNEISDKETLPSLLFLNLDAIYNMFMFYFEHLKSWKDVMDKIVIDEVHTVFLSWAFATSIQCIQECQYWVFLSRL